MFITLCGIGVIAIWFLVFGKSIDLDRRVQFSFVRFACLFCNVGCLSLSNINSFLNGSQNTATPCWPTLQTIAITLYLFIAFFRIREQQSINLNTINLIFIIQLILSQENCVIYIYIIYKIKT